MVDERIRADRDGDGYGACKAMYGSVGWIVDIPHSLHSGTKSELAVLIATVLGWDAVPLF